MLWYISHIGSNCGASSCNVGIWRAMPFHANENIGYGTERGAFMTAYVG